MVPRRCYALGASPMAATWLLLRRTVSSRGRSSMKDVVITGFGPILPNCDGRETFWQHISKGESQLTLEEDPAVPGEMLPMGRVHGFDARNYLKAVPERYYSKF